MPIVDIEIILRENEIIPAHLTSNLADELGRIFNSPPNSTWVKVRNLSKNQYAENDDASKEVFPVFVKIVKSKIIKTEIQKEAELIAVAVGNICERPVENVHIIYEPVGSGRVAFGGNLID